jgi:SAM-dependent methyltransferase
MHVEYKNTFKYFNSLHPTISKGTVLDYGSNSGNFLTSAGAEFPHINYTGIDVDVSAINLGQQLFPTARFIHYNAFNYMYNPVGEIDPPLPINGLYDTIISYSVFTHTTEKDMLSRISELYGLLAPGGRFLFTYLNSSSTKIVEYFTKKRITDFGYCNSISTNTKLYLVDADIKEEPEAGKMLLTFYNTDYLLELLSTYSPKFQTCPESCYNCIQDCVVINK